MTKLVSVSCLIVSGIVSFEDIPILDVNGSVTDKSEMETTRQVFAVICLNYNWLTLFCCSSDNFGSPNGASETQSYVGGRESAMSW